MFYVANAKITIFWSQKFAFYGINCFLTVITSGNIYRLNSLAQHANQYNWTGSVRLMWFSAVQYPMSIVVLSEWNFDRIRGRLWFLLNFCTLIIHSEHEIFKLRISIHQNLRKSILSTSVTVYSEEAVSSLEKRHKIK